MRITRANLGKLVRELAAFGSTIVAPRSQGGYTDFAPILSLDDADLSRVNTRRSIKQFFFPASEPILAFSVSGKDVTLEQADPPKPAKTVILGSRPCDAASLPVMDKVFAWDYNDKFYLDRRAATTVVSISCTDCDECCFCTGLGLAPDSTQGSDILLTPLSENEYLVEACSDKGRELAEAHKGLFDKGEGDKAAACKRATAKLPKPMDLAKIKTWLDAHFEDSLWKDISLKCLGCGCCTFICPTCHCFDIVDEPSGDRGVRRKNWDSCQFAQFTLHASGHNPRADRAARWRQRIMHKFKYYVDRFGPRSCVGCGRCIRECPVQMDLKDQLRRIENLQG